MMQYVNLGIQIKKDREIFDEIRSLTTKAIHALKHQICLFMLVYLW